MRVLQHIRHDQDRSTLLARYLDTMGQEATYVWELDDHRIRVSLDDDDSDTYFLATLNEDKSRYAGTWHYPEGGPSEAAEEIVYTRLQDNR
jgi:hypothetical protein